MANQIETRTGCGAHSGKRERFHCLSCAQADLKVWRTKYQLAVEENVALIATVARLRNELASAEIALQASHASWSHK